jgi:hypothetical protein
VTAAGEWARPATNTWSSGPHLPRTGCYPVSATLQARLYRAGCGPLNSPNPMLVLDPNGSGWSEVAAPALAAWGFELGFSRVTVNGLSRLELIGGAGASSNLQFVP